jgi:hypothetical protein
MILQQTTELEVAMLTRKESFTETEEVPDPSFSQMSQRIPKVLIRKILRASKR